MWTIVVIAAVVIFGLAAVLFTIEKVFNAMAKEVDNRD